MEHGKDSIGDADKDKIPESRNKKENDTTKVSIIQNIQLINDKVREINTLNENAPPDENEMVIVSDAVCLDNIISAMKTALNIFVNNVNQKTLKELNREMTLLDLPALSPVHHNINQNNLIKCNVQETVKPDLINVKPVEVKTSRTKQGNEYGNSFTLQNIKDMNENYEGIEKDNLADELITSENTKLDTKHGQNFQPCMTIKDTEYKNTITALLQKTKQQIPNDDQQLK